MRQKTLFFAILIASSTVLAQNSTIYLQAADINDKQAAACANPAGAACYRQMASYNRCLARQLGPGGATCSAPTCTPACGGASNTSNSSVPNVMGTDTGSTGSVKGDIAVAGLKGLLQWKLNHDAKKDAQQQDTTDNAEAQAQRDADEAAQVSAQAAAEQQKLNNQAADILQQSNALIAANDAGAGLAPSTIPGNSTAAIGALLDSGSSAPDSTAAINDLLDSPSPDGSPATNTANAVAGLLDDTSQSTSQSASQAHLINSLAQTQAAMQPPNGSVYADAYNEQEESPQAYQTGASQYLSNLIQNPAQALSDGLDQIASLKDTAVNAYHNALNDPSVQFVITMHQLYTDGNIGSPTAADTPDQQADKVFVPAMMIPVMALKNGGSNGAQRDAIKSGATTAGENVAIMMGLAMPEPESQP
jgi:hypothetical protein